MNPFANMAARLEKAALDNGFDLVRAPEGGWLPAGSSHAPLSVWLTAGASGHPVAALSRADVARALAGLGTPATVPLPFGAAAAHEVSHIDALHHLLRRAFQLARTLPNELLRTFTEKTATLPRTTEAERLVVQRVGQDVFRDGLLEYWEGRCAVTGLAVPEMLRASHIKPWAACVTDTDGLVVVSEALAASDRFLLGLDSPLRVQRIEEGHRHYLRFHREKVFR